MNGWEIHLIAILKVSIYENHFKNMKNTNLDIITKGNKFLITVNKDQITPDYILEILNWLQYKGNLLSKEKKKINQVEKKDARVKGFGNML